MSDKPGLATAFISLLLFSAMAGVQLVRLAAANFTPAPPIPPPQSQYCGQKTRRTCARADGVWLRTYGCNGGIASCGSWLPFAETQKAG